MPKLYNIILSVIIMNCHYSCATCSANVYMFACLSCPATRYLLDSTCICSSGYYEGQQPACYSSSQATIFTQMVLPIADILYYTNIGLIWLYIIVMYCRVNSPKIRIVVNFAQIIALINNYPVLLDQISKQYLWSVSAFNFNFFFAFFSCDQNSTTCKLFQYVWQPLLVFPGLVICFLFSFLLLNTCYRTSLHESISLKNYWIVSWPIITFTFMDITAVILSYNITKGALLSNWGFIFVGLYLLGIILVVLNFFKTINSKEQSKVLYRGKYSWAYGYDQNYHLYYIDYLYEEARQKSFRDRQRKLEQKIGAQNQAVGNISKMIQMEQLEQMEQNGRKGEKQIKMFMAHSNLYVLELFLKLILGSSTALLYQYKPQLIAYPLVVLINIGLCWIGAFFYYDKFTLLLYWLLSISALFCLTFYWFSIYWFAAMAVAFAIPTIILAVFVVLFFDQNRMNSKLINKMFTNEGPIRAGHREQLSEQQLKLKKQQQSEYNLMNAQNIKQQDMNQQNKKVKREPFVGNITRKVISKNTTKNVISINSEEEDLLKTKTITKSKSIFKNTSNQPNQPPAQPENIIRHSQYQKKISNFKQKMTARNKNKSAKDNLVLIKEEDTNVNDENESKIDRDQDKAEENMSRQNSRGQLLENKASQRFRQSSKLGKDNESNLQNLLNEPSEMPDSKSFSKRGKKFNQQQI